MSKRLSFEEIFKRKMDKLPLPSEDEAWQKMKLLLDEKEKRKPFIFFRNEKTIGSIMLLLLLCLWLMISPEKTEKQTAAIDAKQKVIRQENRHQNKTEKDKQNLTDNQSATQKKNKPEDEPDRLPAPPPLQTKQQTASSQNNISVSKNKQTAPLNKSPRATKKQSLTGKSNEKRLVKESNLNKKNSSKNPDASNDVLQSDTAYYKDKNKTTDSAETLTRIDKNGDSSLSVTIDNNSSKTLIASDSLQQETKNTAAATSAKTNITIKKHNLYFIDAGTGVKQEVPLNGQQIVSYNYNGTKTILSDYIPSAYIRLVKDKQWFLQGEFSYASPRFIKEFTYQQKTKADYNHGNTTVVVNRLQKTWYTQVPVSFNVYVRPYWSVGAGVMYSRLRGAVGSKETIVNDAQSAGQTITTQLLPMQGFTDSFLYKTQTSLVLQTHFEKDKWLFGLRYLQDIQPFITYTLPDGKKNNKKNSSLELLVRYRLFRSSKFGLSRRR